MRRYSLLLVLSALLLANARAAAAAGKNAPHHFLSAVIQLRTAETSAVVAGIRKGLDPARGSGYALIDTRRWISPQALAGFAGTLPNKPGSVWLLKDPSRFESDGVSSKIISLEQQDALLGYIEWVTQALNEALKPREEVALTVADLRVVTRQGGVDLPQFHTDGGYLALTLALQGPGTRYFEKGPRVGTGDLSTNRYDRMERQVNRRTDFKEPPHGSALVFSANDRALAFKGVRETWHASPPTQDRKLLLLRYVRK